MNIKSVRSFLEHGAVVWCATDSGLSRFEDQQFIREEKFPAASAKCLALLDQSDKPWCGTSAGLAYWHFGAWHVVPELAKRDVRSLAFAQAEHVVWCGTNRGLAERRSGKWRFPESDTLPDLCINCLLYEGAEVDPILWCGSEQGLATFDGRSFQLIIPEKNITSLARDPRGTLCCGTDKGLLYQTIDSHTWQSVDWSERVQCLLVDRAGRLWCGTEKALRHFDGQHWQVLHEDRFATGVPCLLEDRHGQIWCGTSKDLVVLRPQGSLYVPVALEEALAPPVPAPPQPVSVEPLTETPNTQAPKGPTPVRPPQVNANHKRETVVSIEQPPPGASQPSSDPPPPKEPQSQPPRRPPPEWRTTKKEPSRSFAFSLPSGEQLNWLVVAAMLLAVFVAGNWLEANNASQTTTAKPTGVLANPKTSRPSIPQPGIVALSPVETVQQFYSTASMEGYLRESLTTQRLRSTIAARPEIVMSRGNFLGIDPGSIRQNEGAGHKEVQFVLQVRARPPIGSDVRFESSNGRWLVPTSMRLVSSGGRWQIDRVRYSAVKQCRPGRTTTFYFSDTELFRAGRPIPGRQLPNPCKPQSGTSRPTQY
ncbi:two-component regulator propeller domain-containing protein [Gloeobacter violaceus]|uniref:Glr2968 protein n=1 Tax=Gloeobacter violaceus (strain ATCC 29082 / PCC 7421) TaxID=251221 RepID=Q7NCL0_GLOVI|nr:two-component regulator propeller domain-containing protein [Gloeobacter violaceus]BAC90909.1 glr2968 [Gloeobacter violaceus PCC 7421]